MVQRPAADQEPVDSLSKRRRGKAETSEARFPGTFPREHRVGFGLGKRGLSQVPKAMVA